jgi:integrase
LFPKIKQEDPKHRAAEFRRRCRTLKIEGRTLHSYRYAWAQRARVAGMPERDAMNHLGHKSRAIHVAYAAAATVTVLPLEFYEAERQKKIVRFDQQNELAQVPLVAVGA